MSRSGTPVLVAIGALFAVAALALVLGLGDNSPPAATETVDSAAVSGEPLPDTVSTLAGALALASRQAKQWQHDAALVRLYATDVRLDGSFDRASSAIQMVFVSRTTGEGQALNAFRWQTAGGRITRTPVSHHPMPEVEGIAPKVCDLNKVAGDDAPDIVTVDARYARYREREPRFSIFTTQPKWLVVADPHSCEVSSRPEAQPAASARDAAPDDGGAIFAREHAQKQVLEVLSSASTCRADGGPSGQGRLGVRFDKSGKVTQVEFHTARFRGTEVERCLAGRLRKIRVPSWERGRGYIVKGFEL